jgi:malonate transporter and related proteins
MVTLFVIVLPIFALVGAGWVSRRFGVLGPAAATEINRFVVWLALPALMFEITAKASWHDLDKPAFIATFFAGCLAIFAATVAVQRLRGRGLAQAGVDGLTAGYANVGFIGFPLLTASFAAATLPLGGLASIITVCALFAVAIAVVEAGVATAASPGGIAISVIKGLARNPLVISPIAGAMVLATHISLPSGIDRFLSLLAQAASPAALVSLGAFVADKTNRVDWTVTPLVAAKLIGQPLVTWLLALFAFHLAPRDAAVAIILSALPTGTGPYMIADLYGCDGRSVANGVLLSTILSIVSITVLLAWLS